MADQLQTTQEVVAQTSKENKLLNSWFWLRGHDQTFVSACVGVFLVLVTVNWLKMSGWGVVPLEIDRQATRQYDYRIDIDRASWIEWAQIDGIGETTARKIVADRDANGPFRSFSEIRRIKGIGPKTLERIRPYLRLTEGVDQQVEVKPDTGRD